MTAGTQVSSPVTRSVPRTQRITASGSTRDSGHPSTASSLAEQRGTDARSITAPSSSQLRAHRAGSPTKSPAAYLSAASAMAMRRPLSGSPVSTPAPVVLRGSEFAESRRYSDDPLPACAPQDPIRSRPRGARRRQTCDTTPYAETSDSMRSSEPVQLIRYLHRPSGYRPCALARDSLRWTRSWKTSPTAGQQPANPRLRGWRRGSGRSCPVLDMAWQATALACPGRTRNVARLVSDSGRDAADQQGARRYAERAVG